MFRIFLLSSLLSFQAFAQDIAPDIIAAPLEETPSLSQEQLQAERSRFLDFITIYQSSEFSGHAQYTLSALNLSIKTHVHYSVELNGTVLFQMATAGNHWVTRGDVTFPMQGLVYFEIKDRTGEHLRYLTQEGEEIKFEGKKNIFYVVESEEAFKTRRKVQSKHVRGGAPIGRFFAKVQWDLFTQKIEFYELNDNLLVRRGSFTGNVPKARRNW